MGELIAFEDPVGTYIGYLTRSIRCNNMTLLEVHQHKLSRLVAEEYGVTQEQMVWLDDNL